MSQQQTTQNKPVTPPVVNTPNFDEVERQLKIEQLKALQRENAKAEAAEFARLEALEIDKKRRKELVRAQEQEQQRQTVAQNLCSHSRNGKSLVVGQGTWEAHKPPIYMCQSCMKVWERQVEPGVFVREYPPAHLMPIQDSVGGPQVN